MFLLFSVWLPPSTRFFETITKKMLIEIQINKKQTYIIRWYNKTNSADCFEMCLGCGRSSFGCKDEKRWGHGYSVPPDPRAHSGSGHSMPFRSIWLAAMSMTLMMNAIAKAQIKLFLTHVCRFFFFGWTEGVKKKRENVQKLETYNT